MDAIHGRALHAGCSRFTAPLSRFRISASDRRRRPPGHTGVAPVAVRCAVLPGADLATTRFRFPLFVSAVLAALPMKIEGGTGAPVRIVALIPPR